MNPMSKYTTQLRYPIEQKLKDKKLDNIEDNWAYIYEAIGLNDYPIFDEGYRETLNNKIIRHYYFREIGLETLGLFKVFMRRTMYEIMPYYNQLYLSEKLITDPMKTRNMDYSEKWTRDEATDNKSNSQSDTVSSSTNKDQNIFQDTPMNGLETGAIESGDYATNVTIDKGQTDAQGKNVTATTNSRIGDFEGTKIHNENGFAESQSELLLTYRKTFLNIDLQVIGELESLFIQMW